MNVFPVKNSPPEKYLEADSYGDINLVEISPIPQDNHGGRMLPSPKGLANMVLAGQCVL